MKAAILREKQKMTVEEIPDPKAGPGEVVIKVKYTGICGSDLHLYLTGLLPPDSILGHETCGCIAKIGEGVEDWSVGDEVGIYGFVPCGECFWCRRGRSNICPNGQGIGLGSLPGAYAEFLKVHSKMLVRIPEGVNLADVTLLDPFSTAARGILLSGFKMRETALVMGAGPIGLCVIQQLKLSGAQLVVVTEGVQKRSQLAKEWGADLVLDPNDDVLTRSSELTNGIGVDYVFECVGVPATTQEAFNLVRRAGTVVLVGVCMEPAEVHPVFWMLKEVAMQTTMGFDRDQFVGTLDLIHKGVLNTDGFVTETISIDQVPDAFERLLSPNDEIKVLVDFPD